MYGISSSPLHTVIYDVCALGVCVFLAFTIHTIKKHGRVNRVKSDHPRRLCAAALCVIGPGPTCLGSSHTYTHTNCNTGTHMQVEIDEHALYFTVRLS
jgi:hypothetical protein